MTPTQHKAFLDFSIKDEGDTKLRRMQTLDIENARGRLQTKQMHFVFLNAFVLNLLKQK